MSAIAEVLRFFGLFASLLAWRIVTEYEQEYPVVEAIEDLLQTYEKTLSLYDLLAHFPVEKNVVCPERDRHLPYPGDCTRYITCRNFKAHIRGCPRGMKFDKNILRCRFAFEANCTEPQVHQKCGTNEVFKDCHRGCEKSCVQYTNEYEDCPEECVKGCFCRGGFVRGPMRNCIHPRKCKSENFLEPWFLINSRKKFRETHPTGSE
ncbi:hypothetical protein CDAR_438191 [Caerostris darwini]|uniref:Chitin-binding type-2 domain-containing protein n=1 Tax=Caerostris darwini TaxID=1538125 RepID=A0AAV4X1L0_9ARAC|nr:hypothetical protein CDAR_438191 [Caerostris darwini]